MDRTFRPDQSWLRQRRRWAVGRVIVVSIFALVGIFWAATVPGGILLFPAFAMVVGIELWGMRLTTTHAPAAIVGADRLTWDRSGEVHHLRWERIRRVIEQYDYRGQLVAITVNDRYQNGAYFVRFEHLDELAAEIRRRVPKDALIGTQRHHRASFTLAGVQPGIQLSEGIAGVLVIISALTTRDRLEGMSHGLMIIGVLVWLSMPKVDYRRSWWASERLWGAVLVGLGGLMWWLRQVL